MTSRLEMLSKEMESAIANGDRAKITQLASQIADEREKFKQDNAQVYASAKAMTNAAPQDPPKEAEAKRTQAQPEEGKEWEFFEKMEAHNLYLEKNKDMTLTMGIYAATAARCVLGICDEAVNIAKLAGQGTTRQNSSILPDKDLALPVKYALFAAAYDQLYMRYVAMRFMSKEILKDEDALVDSMMRYIHINAAAILKKDWENPNIEANDALYEQVRRILTIIDKMSVHEIPMLKGETFVPGNRWETLKAVCDEVGCAHYEEIKEKAIEVLGVPE